MKERKIVAALWQAWHKAREISERENSQIARAVEEAAWNSYVMAKRILGEE